MPTLIKPSRAFPDHLLTTYRQQGDAPADAVIREVVDAGGPAGLRALMGWLADAGSSSTVGQPSSVQDFFVTYAALPAWADPAQMQRGMAFFRKHAQKIGLVLGFSALPYTYLGANGVQVLWLTERIKNDTARRLQETGEWVFAVNNPNQWFLSAPSSKERYAVAKETGGEVKAITKTLKIRLIHAGARWFSLHSGRWTMDWGYPVNQEDMAGTNLAFSYIVLLGLRKLGVTTTEQEEEDYLHHSNVVNYVNGVADELLPKNLREAYSLSQVISQRQFAPSEAGAGLTRSLLNAVANLISQQPALKNRTETIRNLAASEMRFFLGDKHADWLGIPNTPVEKRLVGLINRLPIFPDQLSGL